MDCSGQDGDCYVSYDGTCRPGFAPGSYVLNTADSGNLNKGSGDLPSSMQCNEGKEDSVFGCSNLVHMQFCCRAAAPPTCPFFLGSAPCAAARADECAASYATDPECLGVVHEYCFESPEDPACNAFRPLRVPADFCPLPLAMEWCAAHPDGEECSSVFTKVSDCMFTEYDGWSPCTMPVCQESVLSDECTPWVVSHCQQHPEDRECDLYGFGDGCMFRPGAQPCQASVCNVLPDAYNQKACDDIIETYCSSLVGGAARDPECAAQGYGGPPPEAVPVRTSCPWSAIEMQCRESPASPLCVRMHAAGVNVSDPTAGTLPSVAMLQPHIEQQGISAAEAFAEVGVLREMDRRSGRCAADLAVQLWRIANTNNDSSLTQDELDLLIKAGTVMLQLDRRFDETPSIAVMHDMLQTISYGEYVTYSEFLAFVDGFFVIKC